MISLRSGLLGRNPTLIWWRRRYRSRAENLCPYPSVFQYILHYYVSNGTWTATLPAWPARAGGPSLKKSGEYPEAFAAFVLRQHMAPWFVVWRMDIQWKWRTINLNSVFRDFISSLIWGLCADRFTCCDNFGKKTINNNNWPRNICLFWNLLGGSLHVVAGRDDTIIDKWT